MQNPDVSARADHGVQPGPISRLFELGRFQSRVEIMATLTGGRLQQRYTPHLRDVLDRGLLER
jgi:hypothetical protein